jgi:hypothetical protein
MVMPVLKGPKRQIIRLSKSSSAGTFILLEDVSVKMGDR